MTLLGMLAGCASEPEQDEAARTEPLDDASAGGEGDDGPAEVVGDVELVTEACYLAADVWAGMTELDEPQTELLRELTAMANRSGNPQVREGVNLMRVGWGRVDRAYQNSGDTNALQDFAHAMDEFADGAEVMEEQCEPAGVPVLRSSPTTGDS